MMCRCFVLNTSFLQTVRLTVCTHMSRTGKLVVVTLQQTLPTADPERVLLKPLAPIEGAQTVHFQDLLLSHV